MDPDFASFKDLPVAQARCDEIFPAGTPRPMVEAKMKATGAELFSLPNHVLNTRLVLGNEMVKTVWMVSFIFNDDEKVVKLTVKKGFLGP